MPLAGSHVTDNYGLLAISFPRRCIGSGAYASRRSLSTDYMWEVLVIKLILLKLEERKPERSFADYGHKGNAKKSADSTWG